MTYPVCKTLNIRKNLIALKLQINLKFFLAGQLTVDPPQPGGRQLGGRQPACRGW